MPRAWSALVGEPEDLLLDLMAEKAEALCGFRPDEADVLAYLRRLGHPADAPSRPGTMKVEARATRPAAGANTVEAALASTPRPPETAAPAPMSGAPRKVHFRLFGSEQIASNASDALVIILKGVCSRDPSRLPELAMRAGGRTRSHIGRSPSEVYPDRADLRVIEFLPGWFVGLNVANREKMRLIRAACAVYGLTMPDDVTITLPNAA